MKCRFEHDGECCNSGARLYMCYCRTPCDTIVPLNNADRIRAMSDEELAKNLYWFCDLEERVGYCKNLSECEKLLDTEDGIPEQRCIYCLLEWLKQPAEE